MGPLSLVRDFRSRIQNWLISAFVGCWLLAALEFGLTAISLPHYNPPVSGALLSILKSASTIAIPSLVLAPMLCLFEVSVCRGRLRLRLSGLVAVLAMTSFAVILFATADSFLEEKAAEFPDAISAMRMVLQGASLLLAGATSLFGVFYPLRSRISHDSPLNSQRFLVALIAGITLGTAQLLLHGVLAPVYLTGPSLAAHLLGLVAATVLCRVLLPDGRRVALGWTASLMALLCVSGTFAQSPHSQYMSYSHLGGTAPLAARLRDWLDFDGDGTTALVLGGTDCAEFDASRGPLVREIPHDGIDQDCQGGDAGAPWPEREVSSPWQDCGVPLSSRPSILLLTIDALRADRVSPTVTPNLNRLRHSSTYFSRAYVASPLTLVSLSTLFSGKPLSDLGMSNPVAEDILRIDPNLVRDLTDTGYQSAAFEFFGVDRRVSAGFDVLNPTPVDVVPAGIKVQLGSAQMAQGIAKFIQSSPSPTLVWAHFPDAHAPYLTPPGVAHEFQSPYDAALNYVDRQLGRLFAELTQTDHLRSMIVVITADHGEELRQHGREGHGPQLYEESVRVPLLVHVPGCPSAVVEHPVSLTSLLQSLHDIRSPERRAKGLGSRNSGRPIVVEEAPTLGLGFKRAVITERYKLIVDQQNGGRVLFDLDADWEETSDIYGSQPDISKKLERHYQQWLDSPDNR